MSGHDASADLVERVREAIARRRPLAIRGGGSKADLGRPADGETLDTRVHHGIVAYEPGELVLTARAGTPLSEVERALEASGQMLAFEPPHLGDGATLGGMLASGLSGPRRPWAGAVRDHVLGVRLVDGRGALLRFGGEVMKNVAGYDVSRLMAGSWGCLGLVTEVSLKVLPRPRACAGVRLELSRDEARARLMAWGRQPMPISAACHDGDALLLRLEGGEAAVCAARDRLGGDAVDDTYWTALRERRLPFFDDPAPLWRLSLPAHAPPLDLPGRQFIDWGGAQRWLLADGDLDATHLRVIVAQAGGHATRMARAGDAFHPLPPAMLRIHQRLKHALDPFGIFNPGRLYREL
ncbi:glycolate oxidase subunit GlcE [Dokdonella sp. MW10]|uniref:glycolate oxidase subunit GlcE n=1 Tax=Dokdonella sp. MW10 TaxID=2992926 RepID=UPI003F820C76